MYNECDSLASRHKITLDVLIYDKNQSINQSIRRYSLIFSVFSLFSYLQIIIFHIYSIWSYFIVFVSVFFIYLDLLTSFFLFSISENLFCKIF